VGALWPVCNHSVHHVGEAARPVRHPATLAVAARPNQSRAPCIY
jgi:hypothetical protein